MVLAAGGSERFGATKLVAEVAGRPLVAYAVAAAHQAGLDRVILVVGHDAEAVVAAASAGGVVDVVVNPEHHHGQATSLRAGITAAAADPSAEVAVVLLADQPAVSSDAVRTVTAAVADGAVAARASYVDGPGHPVAFARRVWDRLTDVTGDKGARDLLDDLAVAHVLVGGPVPGDVDTPADLDRVRSELRDGPRPGDH